MAKDREFDPDKDIMGVFIKEIKKVESNLNQIDIIYKKDLRRLDRISDRIAVIGGSWIFILSFLVVLVCWVILNSVILMQEAFDPFPYILLNLFLSMVAAIQAPVILMSQNRAAHRDQARAELDLEKDLRDLHIDMGSHKILLDLKKDVAAIKKKLKLK
ncbi:DUF1003 domain-containing protein [Candidatus Woesearchaeota archaeon]|nr:DUF1003 domain-containing protein [Candidatus Woesearchaeota archaeon]